MSLTTSFTENSFLSASLQDAEMMIRLGSQAVFQIRSVATAPHVLSYIDRRDRAILFLLDGKRTLSDVARLTRRDELEVAQLLVRFLKRGYIEFVGSPLLAR